MKIDIRVRLMCLGLSNNISARTDTSNLKVLFRVVSAALGLWSLEMFA